VVLCCQLGLNHDTYTGEEKAFEPRTFRSNGRILLTVLFGFSLNSSRTKERANEPVVPSTETNRLQDKPLYFLIRFESSFAITLDTQVFMSKEILICMESTNKDNKWCRKMHLSTAYQGNRNRHRAPVRTSIERFVKNIDKFNHACMQQDKAHNTAHVYHTLRVPVGAIKNPG